MGHMHPARGRRKLPRFLALSRQLAGVNFVSLNVGGSKAPNYCALSCRCERLLPWFFLSTGWAPVDCCVLAYSVRTIRAQYFLSEIASVYLAFICIRLAVTLLESRK